MMGSHKLAFAVLTTASLAAVSTSAQAVEAKFRGMIMCEKLPTTRDILRAPLDMVIHDGNIQFARPLFNLNGTGVVGTELGAGTIDSDGKVHLTSEWTFRGNTAEGDYSGTLSEKGGTLTGTQTWRGPNAATLSRTCTAAVVRAPSPRVASQEQQSPESATPRTGPDSR